MATNKRYGECVLWRSQRVVRLSVAGLCESMKMQVRGYVGVEDPWVARPKRQ
jgi:hypothetical protein